MEFPKFSIITPMYNSFELMYRYFESLERQTYKNFEVIIVDDCSNDGSYEKLCNYIKKLHLQIYVFRVKENCGPGNARNIGMDVARGEWITFIDNDDWVDVNLLSKINNITKNKNINCIIYDYYTTDGNKKNISKSMYSGIKGNIAVNKCIINARNHTVGKFYKLTNCNINKVRFPKLKRCEDVAFVCRAIDACGSVYYLNEPLYYYYQRKSSLSNNKELDEKDMIAAFKILEETIGEKYKNELKEKSVTDLLYGVVLMMCKNGKNNVEIEQYIKSYEEKNPKWWKYNILNQIGKPKKIFLIFIKYRFIILIKILAYIHGKMIK